MMSVMDDDLNAPLGHFTVRKRPALGTASYIWVISGGLGLVVLAAFFLGFGELAPSGPRAGSPAPGMATSAAGTLKTASLNTESRQSGSRETLASPMSVLPPLPGAWNSREASPPLTPAPFSGASIRNDLDTILDPAAGPGAEAIERQSGVKILRPGGGTTPGALIIDVAKVLNMGRAGTPDPRLIEPTRYGPIPRIGADGARPSEIYARPAVSLPGMPRIALLVGGLGLAPRATEAAIAGLPGAVTLGFAPYGAGLARQTTRAREAGHELVLELPMEPFDPPRDNPGPHTLAADAGDAGNSDNLTWLMSRFTGYAGVANFLGGKFTADEKALTPVLREIAGRGLFFMDDGSSARSLVMTLAPGHALAAARADIVLDSAAAPEAIETALAQLETIARDKGLAIGVASALPASVEMIGRFARALEARGIALVPLSAVMPAMRQGLPQQGGL